MQIYLVGGAVRDTLLGLPVVDHDWVVVGATVQQMLDAGYRQVGRDFPVFLHPKTGEEYALARTERKQGSGYKGFAVHSDPSVTLEQDLLRRDLTINAMAQDPDGQLIDPYGGYADLQARLLRHVSPAFTEDPLRVLRVARFAARLAPLGFRVAEPTRALMRTLSESGELDALTPERVWQEIEGGLRAAAPQVFIEVLRECGALERLLPQIQQLFSVSLDETPQPATNAGQHTLLALEQAAALSPEAVVRFAVLVRLLGRTATPPERLPGLAGHEEVGAALIEALAERLRIPNEFRDLGILASRHLRRCHEALAQDAAQRYATLEATDALRRPGRFAQFLLVCEADARAGDPSLQSYPQAALLQQDLATARAVDIPALLAQRPENTDPGTLIREARIQAIALRG
ncbi:MAG TPA: multifunctional CCA addition/repair protein [Hyphomicrobiales bacterium]|nr:multifunctional CCA addition/repair protein [Hyphomicrobiales bacterium]